MRRFLGALLGVAALLALPVAAHAADGTTIEFPVRARIDTPVELDYYRQGGILPLMVRKFLAEK